jgi:hypothetical protein
MGGYGSGRRSTKPKVGECSSLDANQLSRIGCFKSGWYGTTTFSRNGKKFSSIGMRATANYLHLGYSTEHYGSVIQPIRIERLPCRFGGSRAYFRCECGKRVVKLYGFGRFFLCRHCYGLFHYSKNEGFWDRSLRQRTKRKRRLTDDGSLEAYEMPKPKGMWWRTYYRLQRRVQAAERRSDDGFLIAARRLLKMG